jgi:arsenate reductase
MIMTVSIYHNSRCSKSRQTLALLNDNGIQPDIIEYLKTPPDQATLITLLKMLGIGPRELLRKGEDVYRELNLGDTSLDDEALIAAMIAHPILIERPIVVSNGKAVIGRPPENVLDII